MKTAVRARGSRTPNTTARPLIWFLVIADRSSEVRDEAARANVIVMNKPLKPAPLRAKLARYSAIREAVEQGAESADGPCLQRAVTRLHPRYVTTYSSSDLSYTCCIQFSTQHP
jgi:hypothetical protein